MKNEALIPELKKHEFKVLRSQCIVDGIRKKLADDFAEVARKKYFGATFSTSNNVYEVVGVKVEARSFSLTLIGKLITDDKKVNDKINKIWNAFNGYMWQLHGNHKPEFFLTKEYTISIDLITKEPNLAI